MKCTRVTFFLHTKGFFFEGTLPSLPSTSLFHFSSTHQEALSSCMRIASSGTHLERQLTLRNYPWIQPGLILRRRAFTTCLHKGLSPPSSTTSGDVQDSWVRRQDPRMYPQDCSPSILSCLLSRSQSTSSTMWYLSAVMALRA